MKFFCVYVIMYISKTEAPKFCETQEKSLTDSPYCSTSFSVVLHRCRIFRVKEETILKITLNAKKMQISDSFTEYAQQRLNAKLDKFFGDEADAKLMLNELKGKIILELTVRYNQMIYRSEQSAADKRDALDAAIDKIIRQIRKNKTRLEKRLKDTAFKEEFQDAVEEQVDFNVIRRKQFSLRPMSVEEAILQMDMLGHSFFMFKDATNGKTCVVYQREDEGYAVLEPSED